MSAYLKVQNYAARFLLFIWIGLWIWFLYHSWFLQKNRENNLSNKFAHLLRAASTEERERAVVGPAVYGFIQYAQGALPPSATFRIEGMDRGSLDFVRTVYFLYPRRFVAESPAYTLVYGGADQYSLKREHYAGLE